MTTAQLKSAFAIAAAVTSTIQQLGSIPSGELYSLLMTKGMDLETYESLIRTITKTGLVKLENNLLTWIGPAWERN